MTAIWMLREPLVSLKRYAFVVENFAMVVWNAGALLALGVQEGAAFRARNMNAY